jgi:hypothetical protein
MTIYRQTITLTVFSHASIDMYNLQDSLKLAVGEHGGVVDVEFNRATALDTNIAETELWERGFDPNVMDGYNQSWFDDWKYQISNGDTKLGFSEWLEHQTEYLSCKQF